MTFHANEEVAPQEYLDWIVILALMGHVYSSTNYKIIKVFPNRNDKH